MTRGANAPQLLTPQAITSYSIITHSVTEAITTIPRPVSIISKADTIIPLGDVSLTPTDISTQTVTSSASICSRIVVIIR